MGDSECYEAINIDDVRGGLNMEKKPIATVVDAMCMMLESVRLLDDWELECPGQPPPSHPTPTPTLYAVLPCSVIKLCPARHRTLRLVRPDYELVRYGVVCLYGSSEMFVEWCSRRRSS